MFCMQCGTQLPDIAKYCTRCGASTRVSAVMPSQTAASEGAAPVEVARPAAVPSVADLPPIVQKGVRSSYIWFTVDLVILTLLLCLLAFNVAWQSVTAETEKAGESVGRLLVPLILMGYWGKRAWASILQREPETNPFFRRHYQSE